MQFTENYKLTIYEPNDVTAYMTSSGWNGTMTKIDTAMGENATNVAKAQTDIATLEQQASSSHDEINNLTGEVSDLKETVTGNVANIAGLNTRVTTAETDIVELKKKSGQDAYYFGVLSANEVTLAVEIGDFYPESSSNITIVRVSTSVYDLTPETVELRQASGGQPNLCVMTFDPQATDVTVSVQIVNIDRGGM